MSVDEMKAQFHESLLKCDSLAALEQLKRDYLGKKGFIRRSLSKMGSIAPQDRKTHAIALNQLKSEIEKELNTAISLEQARLLQERLKTEWIDIALPGINTKRGARHPLNEVERRSLAVLRQLGFDLVEGPEVDNAFHNFSVRTPQRFRPECLDPIQRCPFVWLPWVGFIEMKQWMLRILLCFINLREYGLTKGLPSRTSKVR